eukprot:12897792-Prorocentrum_lima.AAC.1
MAMRSYGGGVATFVWPVGFPREEVPPPRHLRWYGFPHSLHLKLRGSCGSRSSIGRGGGGVVDLVIATLRC